MRISDWSSDVCSSDLIDAPAIQGARWTGAARLPHKLRCWRIAVAPPEQRVHLISINLPIREQDDRAFNDIAQFAHIPTPFMMDEPFHRTGRKVQYGFRRRAFPEKILYQRRHGFRPLDQGRQV